MKLKEEPVINTTTSKLTGSLINKTKEAETTLELKEGSVIDVVGLKVQTPVAPDVYTGKLTVLSIALKGSESGLKIKGVPPKLLPDTYYTFKQGDTGKTCTASLTQVRENLEKK